jgi:hypothetical protein
MTISVCIATGASLTQDQVDYVRGKAKVYVVSDAYRLAPWADVLYSCDFQWWNYHKPEFAGEKWTISDRAASEFGINHITQGDIEFSLDKSKLGTGGNSGFQAINLAYLQGATKIILLGFDYKDHGHFFGDHPSPLSRGSDYARWLGNINDAAKIIPITVINCSPGSAIKCFPQMDIRDAL